MLATIEYIASPIAHWVDKTQYCIVGYRRARKKLFMILEQLHLQLSAHKTRMGKLASGFIARTSNAVGAELNSI